MRGGKMAEMGKRTTTIAGVAAALALAVGLAGAAGATTTAHSTVRVSGTIEALALERGVAAYDVAGTDGGCNRLYVWRPATGKRAQLGGARTCRADGSSTGRGVTAIALTTKRAAWIVNRGGNTESVDTLLTSPLRRARELRVAETVRRGSVDAGLGGGWLGGLVSDGSAITFNRWTTALAPDGSASLRSGSLRRLAGAKTVEVAAGAETLTAAAADAGRIAVLRAGGDVAVYRTTGRLIRTVAPSAAGRAVALSGDRLAVLVAARRIELYSLRSGALVGAWPTGASVATRIELEGRTLVYGVGRSVHLLDVVTGAHSTLATHARTIADVQLEPSGVLYAYNTFSGGRSHGTVVFVPAAALGRTFPPGR